MTATIARPTPREATPPAPRPRPPRSRRVAGGPSNLALAALTLSAVVALSRLFTRPTAFFVPVAVVALVVHLVAWSCRRARLELLPSALASALAGALTTTWVSLGHATAYGIPWRGAYHALGPALQTAADAYRSTAAPTEVLTGFVIAAAFGVGCAAFLGDWAAFRMRASTEACLPSFSLFVLSAALAQGHGTVEAAAVYLAGLLAFLLTRQGAVDSPATSWFASRSRQGASSLVATGALVAVVAVGLVSTVGPHLPGATTHALINWRRGTTGDQGRSTGSPLVDIKDRLRSESEEEVFTVKTDHPAYWRMTALDDFNGSGWSLDDTYRRAGGALAGSDDGLPDVGPTQIGTATFRISGLDSLWLPAAYRPLHITGARGVSYSAEAASLITQKATSDGDSYTVSSAIPTVTPAQLAQSPFVSPDEPGMARYLQLPAGLDPEVGELARQHTFAATTPYQAALDLQNWLRGPEFRYSLDVPADDSPNALLDFLTTTRAGFCQQFAASFAALARTIGLPARVAVGFTPGELGSDGLYHVRDDDAHAWPEVYFEGVGWIAFEPTPGRGSPDQAAQAITGEKPGQAADAAPAATATASPTTTAAPGRPAPLPKGAVHPGTAAPKTTVAHHHHANRFLLAVAALVAAALAWALALAIISRAVTARRRAHALTAPARIALAWREVGEALAGAGSPSRPWETPAEFARRAAGEAALAQPSQQALVGLAASFEVAAYSPAGPDDDTAAAALIAARQIKAELATARPWWSRLALRLDPRPVWRAVSPGA